jgi:peptidoglycan/LPS O-acetylase OafA/YrhL
VLDFFRGIAALGIIVFHVLGPYYKWLQSLYVLVDFFFVLSGYVLANSMNVTSWNKVRNFIQKRARRIFPMVLSALLFSEMLRVTAVLMNDSDKTQSILLSGNRLINLLIAIALFQIFSFQSQLLLFPLWSLSAEWIVNIVGVVCRKIFGQIQTLMFISIGVTLFCTSTYLGLLVSESNWAISLGRCLMCFGVGQAIQQMSNTQQSK